MEKVFQAVAEGKIEEVQLPEFVCHKIVRAAKIVAITVNPSDSTVRLALEGPAYVDVHRNWSRIKMPQIGGYFVKYADGYTSYSPAKAFEEGYVPIEGMGASPIQVQSQPEPKEHTAEIHAIEPVEEPHDESPEPAE